MDVRKEGIAPIVAEPIKKIPKLIIKPDPNSETGYSDNFGNPMPKPEGSDDVSGGQVGGAGGGHGGNETRIIEGNPSPEMIEATKPIPSQPQPTQAELRFSKYVEQKDLGNGYYIRGGVYTSDDKFYPTTNPNFVPKGYANLDTYNQKKRQEFYQEIYSNPKYGGGYTEAYTGNMVVPATDKDILTQNIAVKPTKVEIIQSKIKRATGISVPTPTQAYNILFKGAELGTPEAYQKVSVVSSLSDVPQALFVTAPYQASKFVVGSTTKSETAGKVAGVVAVAGTLYATGSTKVVGSGVARGFNTIFGLGLVSSGASEIANKQGNLLQKSIGVGEVAIGGLLLRKGIHPNEILSPILKGSSNVVNKVAGKLNSLYNIIEPVRTTEFGYLGGNRVVRPFLNKVGKNIYTLLKPADNQPIVLGGELMIPIIKTGEVVSSAAIKTYKVGKNIYTLGFDVGKRFVSSTGKAIKGYMNIELPSKNPSYGFIGESPRALQQQFMQRNYIPLFKEPNKSALFGYNIAISNIGNSLRNLKQSTRLLNPIPPSKFVAKKLSDILRPSDTTIVIGGELKDFGKNLYLNIKNKISKLPQILKPYKTTITLGEPIETFAKKIWSKLKAEPTPNLPEYKPMKQWQLVNYILSKPESISISKTPFEQVMQGYKIAKEGLKYPFVKYKEAVIAASEKEKLIDYLIKGGKRNPMKGINVEPIADSKPSIVVKNVAPKEIMGGGGGQALIVPLEEPQIVTGLSTSVKGEFTGKNQYELTTLTSGALKMFGEGGKSLQFGEAIKVPTTNGQVQLNDLSFSDKTKDIEFNKIKFISKIKDLSKSGNKELEIAKTNLIDIDVTGIKDVAKIKERQLQKDLQLFKQEQSLKQRQLLKQKSRLKLFAFTLPRGKSSKPNIVSKVKKAFDVVVFNRGKEQKIASNLPEGLAKKAGVREVLSNLRASFKLKPRGTTTIEDIEYKLPSSFRLSKVDKDRYVQKLTTRFGARGETKEAQFFRKVKKGKVKWF